MYHFRFLLLGLTAWAGLFTSGAIKTSSWLIHLVTVPGLPRTPALFGLELFAGLAVVGTVLLGLATLAFGIATIRAWLKPVSPSPT